LAGNQASSEVGGDREVFNDAPWHRREVPVDLVKVVANHVDEYGTNVTQSILVRIRQINIELFC
jgi:hypothetical protein